MKKKNLSLMCAAMLAATAIPANFAMADETKDAENLTEWAMDEPVTLTVLKNQNPATVNYADGEDQYNNVYYNAYRDNLGITLDFQICASGDEYSQKVTLAIASDDLPDLLYLPVAEYSQLAEAGKLAPLDDVLEQYGSELTKKNLNSDGGKILEAAKRNDVLYGIPSGNAERIPSQFLWIRKDWLDKLGLDVPKTLDDVVEVARAFKNDDPDGNGVDDTWGLGVCNEMSDYAGGRKRLTGAKANPDFTLTLTYEEREECIYDCKPLLDKGGVFVHLRKYENFARMLLSMALYAGTLIPT